MRAEDFVFMDESGVNRAMTRAYARSLCGTRAFGSAPRNWGDNVSILGALCLRGTLEPMCVNGATDGRVFLTYLKDVLVPQLWPGAVVVMDNLGAHKVKGVQELIEAAGARLLYLPPYSADFNPSRWPGQNSRACCAKPKHAPAKPWTAPSARACTPSTPATRADSSNTAATSANPNE